MAVELIKETAGFTKAVLRNKGPVLVSFRAAACLPSQQMISVIDELEKDLDGRAKVVAVDVAEDDWRENEILRQHKITRLPVVMLFENGAVRDFIGGETTRESIAEMVTDRLSPVLDVGARDFEREVLGEKGPVLVHFHAAWCKQSLELLPEVESIAKQFDARAKVVRVEFGAENAALSERFGVSRVPTLALFRDGEVVDQIFGAMRGGAKVGARRASCVGLTTAANIGEMLEAAI